MAAISKMTRLVAINAPGCADPLIDEYLLMSAIDFCRRSYVWNSTERETLALADFPFDVSAPASGRVFKVVSISLAGVVPPLERAALRDLDMSVTDWRTITGTPNSFIEEVRGAVTVAPLPSVATDFDITAVYEPSETATTIADSIYNEHRDTIISGAIMRLAIIPNMSWTDMTLAVVHRGIYEDGISRALVKFNNNHALQQMLVSPSPI